MSGPADCAPVHDDSPLPSLHPRSASYHSLADASRGGSCASLDRITERLAGLDASNPPLAAVLGRGIARAAPASDSAYAPTHPASDPSGGYGVSSLALTAPLLRPPPDWLPPSAADPTDPALPFPEGPFPARSYESPPPDLTTPETAPDPPPKRPRPPDHQSPTQADLDTVRRRLDF